MSTIRFDGREFDTDRTRWDDDGGRSQLDDDMDVVWGVDDAEDAECEACGKRVAWEELKVCADCGDQCCSGCMWGGDDATGELCESCGGMDE